MINYINRCLAHCSAIIITGLLFTACSSTAIPHNNIEHTLNIVDESIISDVDVILPENSFDARLVDIGSMVHGLSISKIEVNSLSEMDYFANVAFDGELELTGDLHIQDATEISAEGWGLGNLFQPDEKSSLKLPVLNIDTRGMSFTMEDNEEKQLSTLSPGTYKVTLKINHYEIWYQGKAQENKAKLVKIIHE